MPKRVGGIWPSIYDIENIKFAHHFARKDKSHYDAVKKTDENLEERAQEISDMLKNHTYKVGLYKTSRYFDRGKHRILYKLPYYPDRIIQWAIMLKIEPYFNKVFVPFTCASLPNRGIHQASEILTKYLYKHRNEELYCLKIDIKKFYPNINRKILKQLLQKVFKDKDLLFELDNIIDSFDKNDLYKLNLTDEEKAIYCKPGKGVPVGSYLSQYLANFYLAYFDHWLAEKCKCECVIRYMDDIVILAKSKEFLHNLLCAIKIYLKFELDLELKETYSIYPVSSGIDFVGFRHFSTYKLLRHTSYKNFKRNFINLAKKDEITESDWCSTVSECGWLTWCNSYNLYNKYIFPLMGKIGSYYWFNKKNNNKHKQFLLFLKYENKHKKNMQVYKEHISHKKIHKKENNYETF